MKCCYLPRLTTGGSCSLAGYTLQVALSTTRLTIRFVLLVSSVLTGGRDAIMSEMEYCRHELIIFTECHFKQTEIRSNMRLSRTQLGLAQFLVLSVLFVMFIFPPIIRFLVLAGAIGPSILQKMSRCHCSLLPRSRDSKVLIHDVQQL